jgi:hypothetical protein
VYTISTTDISIADAFEPIDTDASRSGKAEKTTMYEPMKEQTKEHWSAWITATTGGLLIGAVDFRSPVAWPAILMAVVGGGIIGALWPTRRWKLAAWFGLCVPIAIIAAMAMRYHPARGHFVFLDARASPLALLGAAIGGMRDRRWARKRSEPESM